MKYMKTLLEISVSYTEPHILVDSIRSPDKVLILLMESISSLQRLYILNLIILQGAYLPTNHVKYYEL
jgi:hypothetical protein